jgi:Na+-driven multidrug efflux pump
MENLFLKNINPEKFKSHLKSIVRLSIPVSIGQLGHIMLGVVDSFMVGRIRC